VHVIALHSYKSPSPEDLTFSQGDTIILLAKGNAQTVGLVYPGNLKGHHVLITMNDFIPSVNQDWFEGQCNGDTGIFPAAFVEVPADAQ